MRGLKTILTSLAFLPAGAVASLGHLPMATPFYRQPEALFASGQANRQILEKNLQRNEQEMSFVVRWDKKVFTVKADEVLLDIQCAQKAVLQQNSQLLLEPRGDSRDAFEITRGESVEVLRHQGPWAKVRNGKKEGWLPFYRLKAVPQDQGVFITLIDTYLRTKAGTAGKIITTIPSGTRLQTLAWSEDWIQVRQGDLIGYIDLHHVVGRADFAIWAWHKNKNWVLVSHRDGGILKTKEGASIPLSEISAYTTSEGKAIGASGESVSLPLRAHAQIEKNEVTLWGVSRLEGHGDVWWKKEFLILNPALEGGSSITTEELFKRPIFSYAFEGHAKMEGLVSAQGIWKTTDGLTWSRVGNFGDQDFPVAAKNGQWFVGSYQSRDKGKNFDPFIRWDTLAKTIEGRLHHPPRYVRLQKVDPVSPGLVDLLIDTGVKRLSLRIAL